MDDNEVRKQLDRIIADPAFSPHGRMAKLLTYVVEETLAGRANRIKAYSIALSVFERSESFDPQTDSLVRVEALRLRRQLNSYYAENGKKDPVIIEIPTGRYVPKFQSRIDLPSPMTGQHEVEGTKKKVDTVRSPGRRKRQIVFCAVAGVVTLFIISGLGYLVWRDADPVIRPNDPGDTVTLPIIDVLPLVNLTEDTTIQKLAVGVQMQLVDDLSQFKSLRVRFLPQSEVDSPKFLNNQPADYQVSGKLYKDSHLIRLTITLDRATTGYRLWSQTAEVPVTDAGFYSLMGEEIHNMVARLAGASGLLHIKGINRLKTRARKYADTTSSEYECVLRYYAFDQSKDPVDEAYCRACLELYTKAGSQNSLVWAAWSSMLLLDWLAQTGSTDQNLLDEALAAAHKAIQLDPTNAAAHEVMGTILMTQNKHDAAYEAFQRSTELNPSNPVAYVLLGWQQVVLGDWENGIPVVKKGVGMSLNPPGWMRIPLSMDAFRRQDFAMALSEAQAIIRSGDKRGVVLALASAIELGQQDMIDKYQLELRTDNITDIADPMKQISNSLNNSDILRRYTETLMRVSLD